MAYVELWKNGKLITRRKVDEPIAPKGHTVRLGSDTIRISPGQIKTAGKYELRMFAGDVPSSQGIVEIGGYDSATIPTIDGYEITDRLGDGGMGTVWKALQLSTRREAALKLLANHRFGSEKSRIRFQREVELTARLGHPNIARIYDSGLHHGMYYYAMELVEGDTLDHYIKTKDLSHKQILELMHSVCRALQHAHERGVIHRDMKPSNVMITKDGQPHVVDFGLAKTLEDNDASKDITIEGEISGTPAYMSPEQATGRIDDMDERTDVYSLGVMLFHLLTGQFPHDRSGTHFEVIRRIAEEEVRRPREISRNIDKELEALLLKALARMPEDRYSSAGALADDIDNYLKGEPLDAKVRTPAYFLKNKARKHKAAVAVGLAILMAAITIPGYFYTQQKDHDSPLNEINSTNTTSTDQDNSKSNGNIPSVVIADRNISTEIMSWNPQRSKPPAAVLVDGKPFFVMCARSVLFEEIDELHNTGFNTITTSDPNETGLEQANHVGMKVLTHLPWWNSSTDESTWFKWDELEAEFAGYVSHPSLLATILPQEPVLSAVDLDNFKKSSEILHNTGRGTLAYTNFVPSSNRWNRVRRFAEHCDIINFQAWAYSGNALGKDLNLRDRLLGVSYWTDQAVALAGDKPVWVTIQAYEFRNQKPTANQLRASVCLAINHGASGILLEGYRQQLWADWGVIGGKGLNHPELSELRAEASLFAGEIKQLSPAILAGHLANEVSVEDDNGVIDFKAYANPSNTTMYIIAVNTSADYVTRQFRVPVQMQGKLHRLRDKKEIVHNQSMFLDNFLPHETHIYVLHPKTVQQSVPASNQTHINSIGMKFTHIPSGEFLMGSGESAEVVANRYDQFRSQAGQFKDQYPQHRVKISKPFLMQTTEVTRTQWKAVMGSEPWAVGMNESVEMQGNNHPAIRISWEDAVAFCKKLSAKEGRTYRLPTEAEWEYANRAGSQTEFSFGDDWQHLYQYGNYCDRSFAGGGPWQDKAHSDSYATTAPVGSFKPNAWGLYDMHGNVYEWCADWYGNYPMGSVTDPMGPSSGQIHIKRSGGWTCDPRFSRSADRRKNDTPNAATGFRVVLDIEYDSTPATPWPISAGGNRNNQDNGLVLYFDFEDLQPGGKIIDKSGKGNHGQVEGAQWVPNGISGKAFDFSNKRNDAIIVSDSDSLDVEQITMSVWIKTSTTDDNWNRIIDKDYQDGYCLTLVGRKNAGKVASELNKKIIKSNSIVSDGNWHHIVSTYDGKIQQIYIDTLLQESDIAWNGTIGINSYDLTIGNTSVPYDPKIHYPWGTMPESYWAFDGLIDEVRIYNRALSEKEINQLYQSDKAD